MNEKELADLLAAKVQDPNNWLLSIRMLVDRAGLDVTRLVPMTSKCLFLCCWSLLDNMKSPIQRGAFERTVREWAAES